MPPANKRQPRHEQTKNQRKQHNRSNKRKKSTQEMNAQVNNNLAQKQNSILTFDQEEHKVAPAQKFRNKEARNKVKQSSKGNMLFGKELQRPANISMPPGSFQMADELSQLSAANFIHSDFRSGQSQTINQYSRGLFNGESAAVINGLNVASSADELAARYSSHEGKALLAAIENPIPALTSFETRHQLPKMASVISEEKSFDEYTSWARKTEEIEILRSMFDDGDFNVIEEPTEHQLGSFQVRLEPNCGVEVAGCSVVLRITYISIETQEQVYEIIDGETVGLSEEQLEEIKQEIQCQKLEGASANEIIPHIQEFLGSLNSSSVKVIQAQNAVEKEKMEKIRQDKIKQQRKQAERHVFDFQKQAQMQCREEQRWCESLVSKGGAMQNKSWYQLGTPDCTKCGDVHDKCEEEPSTACDQSSFLKKTLHTQNSKAETNNNGMDDSAIYVQEPSSRYNNDFEELEEIGRGAFGIVYKARHKLDGNVYAIKKIKLSDKSSDQNKIIRREITYLSSLNNQYIVRYFQTWVERETNQDIIDTFEDWESSDYYDEEEEEESDDFELKVEAYDSDSSKAHKDRKRRLNQLRSSSLDKNNMTRQSSSKNPKEESKNPLPFKFRLQADNDDASDEEISRRQRANTDQFSLSAQKPAGQKLGLNNRQNFLYGGGSSDEEDEELMSRDYQLHGQLDFQSSQIEDDAFQDKPGSASDNSPSVKGIKILYIQMQYCEGETLQQFLETTNVADPRSEEKLKWKIFRQVLEAVHYLHSRDIIHRDIKPDNIFLDKNKDARLGDFGLAKRIQPIKKNPGAGNDKDQLNKSGHNLRVPLNCAGLVKNMTTGVGTLRFAAPEQFQKGGNKKAYCFAADIYSLGIVLYDMFRSFDISYQEIEMIHESVKNEKVLPEHEKLMPQNAFTLIERMIKREPNERPTLLEVLTSEALPQDDIIKDLKPLLQNHKSSVKLQLMHFLSHLEFPKAIELQYNGDMNGLMAMLTRQQAVQTQEPSSPLPKNKKELQELKKRTERIRKFIELEEMRLKTENGIINDLRRLFESNGAHCVVNLPQVAPIPSERILFLSKAIRLQKWMPDLKGYDPANPNQNLYEALSAVKGNNIGVGPKVQRENRLLTDDFLVLSNEQIDKTEQNSCAPHKQKKLKVEPLFDFILPKRDNDDLGRCWQELQVTKLPELISPKNIFRVIDERGIVLGLQPNLIDALSRELALKKSKELQKIFYIGQRFTQSQFPHELEKKKFAPKGENHACLALTNPRIKMRSEIQSLSEMSQEELMFEVELLHITDMAFRESRLSQRYEIRVSSSELLDAIFEECQVALEDRVPLMAILYEQQKINTALQRKGLGSEAKKELDAIKIAFKSQLLRIEKKGSKINRLESLMKIRGSCKQIEKHLSGLQGIQCRPRFANVMAYFYRLEKMLALFKIYSEEPEDKEQAPIETKKEQAAARNESSSLSRSACNNFLQRPSYIKKMTQVMGASSNSKVKLVFDFSLLLEQAMTHYSGLIFSVNFKQSQPRHNDVLAYGGRFDNNVANFQRFDTSKYIPASVSVSFNCTAISSQLIDLEPSKLKEQQCTIDICIGSLGDDFVEQKIQMMQCLQAEGFRVHVDYSDNYQTNITQKFIEENNVRFTVEVLEDKILCKDHFNFLNQASSGKDTGLNGATYDFKNRHALVKALTQRAI